MVSPLLCLNGSSKWNFSLISSLLGEKEKCCQAKARKGSGWWRSFLFLWYAVFFSEVLNCTSVPEHACIFLFCHLKLLGREHASLWNLCSTFPWGLGHQPGSLWLSETVGLIPRPSNKWLRSYHNENWKLLSTIPSLVEVKVKVKSLCYVPLFATPWTVARQAPLSLGILQARILEWVAISFSMGSSQPRDQTCVSLIAGRLFTLWATRQATIEALFIFIFIYHQSIKNVYI